MGDNGRDKTLDLPANIEAEEAVLGSILISPDAYMAVTPFLRPDQFYIERNKWLFQAMIDLSRAGSSIDNVTLAEILEKQDRLQEVGGRSYLASLYNTVPSPIYAEHYGRIIERKAKQRSIIAAAQRIDSIGRYTDDETETAVMVQEVARTIQEAVSDDAGKSLIWWDDALGQWLATQYEREKQQGKPRVDLPWSSLRWVRPLRAGTLAVVGAQSGVGKTSFLECCAEHWAQSGFRVAFFHFELSHQTMLDRMIARHSGESMETIEAGTVTEAMHHAWERIDKWSGEIQYIHCASWAMERVVSVARSLIRRDKADIIVVDYLQKAAWQQKIKSMNTAQMRGADVETLKSMAEQERVPVMLASQMNREAAHQARKTRHTIRDTGEADDKANLVITLNRNILDDDVVKGDRTYKSGEYSPMVTVRVDKQTLGRTGELSLWMDAERFSFRCLALRDSMEEG